MRAAKVTEVECFSTDVGVEIEGKQRRGDPFARKFERERKRIGERLAAVRECAAHDLFETLPMRRGDLRLIEPVQNDD